MKVIPLAAPQINWHEFIDLTLKVIGRSPTRSLDAVSFKVGDPFSFIASLEEIIQEGTSPRDAVLRATFTLEHVSFSFLAHLSDREFYQYRNLPFIHVSSFEGKVVHRENPDHLLLLTGNLLEWKTLLNNDIEDELFITVLHLFRKMNLRELFD